MYLPIKHFLFTARRNVDLPTSQVQTDRPTSFYIQKLHLAKDLGFALVVYEAIDRSPRSTHMRLLDLDYHENFGLGGLNWTAL